MTNQEAFDKVYRHLLTQRKRSVKLNADGSETTICLYRGGDGLMCAVGALIPDELYDPRIEMTCADDLVDRYPELAVLLGGIERRLLQKLQDVHDHDDDGPDTWPRKLRAVAEEYGLSVPEMSP